MMYLGRECTVEHAGVIKNGRAVREILTFSELTKAGEKLAVEFSYCESHGGKRALPVLWARNGWKAHVLPTWWSVDVYASEDGGAGSCWRKYDPTERKDPETGRRVLNWPYILEATEENKLAILAEIFRRAYGEEANA